MKSSKYRKFEVNIRTLSPLFIGQDQGSQLSPYTDFVQKGNELIFIDANKLINELSKDRELINEFTEQVKGKASNNRSEFELKDFLEKKFNEDLDFFEKERYTIKGEIKHNSIRRFINSSGRQYIPGSTVKGAIMTAIIYDWMINSDKGKEFTNEIKEKILRIWNESKEEIINHNENEVKLAEIKKSLKDKRNSRNNLNYNELNNQKNNLEAVLKESRKLIFKFKDQINDLSESKFLSYIEEGAKIFQSRFIQITDSEFYKTEDKEILELIRLKIKDTNKVSSQWSEAIKSNASNKFELRIVFSDLLKELKFLNNADISLIYKLLNKFSLDCIENELSTLEEVKSENDLSSQLAEYYKNLKNIILKSKDKFAVIRIGGGKTYFDNSIGLIIKNKSPEAFLALRYIFNIGANPTSKRLTTHLFPISRTLEYAIDYSVLPTGWMMLHENELETYIKEDLGKLYGSKASPNKNEQNDTDKSNENDDPIARLSDKFKVTIKK